MILKKTTHKKLNKQRLNVKKIQNKFKFNQIIISLEVPICLSFSTNMSSTEYRNVAYVQYRDVQVPSCPDTRPREVCLGSPELLSSTLVRSDIVKKGHNNLKFMHKSTSCLFQNDQFLNVTFSVV